MITRITRTTSGFLAGLLVLVLWYSDSQAQQETWERHIQAGLAAYAQGNFGEAFTQTKAALEAAKVFGPDDIRLATTLNVLANVYLIQGKYAEAEPLYKRALAIREKALGPEHLVVAQSLNNLAELYRVQGKYAEAEPLYKRSWAIEVNALGPEDLVVAQSLEDYRALLLETGQNAEADKLEARAKAIRPKRAGQNQFVGTWDNIDRNTNGITRIEVQLDGTSPSVHVFGKCHPSDCDWGSTRAEVYGSSVVADLQQNASALRAIFDPGFAETTLTMWLRWSGKLRVEALTRFKDKSGRSNYALIYIFVRRQP